MQKSRSRARRIKHSNGQLNGRKSSHTIVLNLWRKKWLPSSCENCIMYLGRFLVGVAGTNDRLDGCSVGSACSNRRNCNIIVVCQLNLKQSWAKTNRFEKFQNRFRSVNKKRVANLQSAYIMYIGGGSDWRIIIGIVSGATISITESLRAFRRPSYNRHVIGSLMVKGMLIVGLP